MGKAVRFGGNTKIQNTKECWKWKIEFRNEELVPYSFNHNKLATYVVPLALKRQAALEKSLEGTTKHTKCSA